MFGGVRKEYSDAMPTLLILRHGKSDWPPGVGDMDRPLKERGMRDSGRIGVWLEENDLVPDLILTSPANRARSTAERVAMTLGLDARDNVEDPDFYHTEETAMLARLRELSQSFERVMIVGHNPGFEDLLALLSDYPVSPEDRSGRMPTCALGVLNFNGAWADLKPRGAHIAHLILPRELPRKYPYPGPGDDAEWRDRPAYYYRQVGVIPYRLNKGKPEILVISTASGPGKWKLPKGIHDPGLTAAEAAATEAREEAGALGTVAKKAVGRFSVDKWGGTCEVTVYPMEVTELLDEDGWAENYRGRDWVTPAEAKRNLKHRGLAKLIPAFAKAFVAA